MYKDPFSEYHYIYLYSAFDFKHWIIMTAAKQNMEEILNFHNNFL